MKIKFTPVHELAKTFPPIPVKNTVPDWYKDLKPHVGGTENTARFLNSVNIGTPFSGKKCVPMMDYMTSGYAFRTIVDMHVSTRIHGGYADYEYRIPMEQSGDFPLIGSHHNDQMPVSIDGLKRHYVKLYSGWSIRTPRGYSCLFYPNFYLFEKRFTVLPAIVDTDTYDAQLGSIGYFNGDEEVNFTVEAGTVFLTVFPFKRDEWEMELEDKIVRNKDSRVSLYLNQFFEGTYRRFFHTKKSYR